MTPRNSLRLLRALEHRNEVNGWIRVVLSRERLLRLRAPAEFWDEVEDFERRLVYLYLLQVQVPREVAVDIALQVARLLGPAPTEVDYLVGLDDLDDASLGYFEIKCNRARKAMREHRPRTPARRAVQAVYRALSTATAASPFELLRASVAVFEARRGRDRVQVPGLYRVIDEALPWSRYGDLVLDAVDRTLSSPSLRHMAQSETSLLKP